MPPCPLDIAGRGSRWTSDEQRSLAPAPWPQALSEALGVCLPGGVEAGFRGFRGLGVLGALGVLGVLKGF